jgi:hypothetical protein
MVKNLNLGLQVERREDPDLLPVSSTELQGQELAGCVGEGGPLAATQHAPSAAFSTSYYQGKKVRTVVAPQVKLRESAQEVTANQTTLATKQGKRFEARAFAWLRRSELDTIEELRFKFFDAGQQRVVIPDAISFNYSNKSLVISEVKLRNSFDAFIQLRSVYLPVVRKTFPDWKIGMLEIVQFYNPMLKFPTALQTITEPKDVKAIPFESKQIHFVAVVGKV